MDLELIKSILEMLTIKLQKYIRKFDHQMHIL